mmetsp:Transcript_40225/g.92475  ORF Transcript_40225/g.92475 Transcript_40225/m.92475 type:complete len:227 (+) Transcript_40225:1154-1834(+)
MWCTAKVHMKKDGDFITEAAFNKYVATQAMAVSPSSTGRRRPYGDRDVSETQPAIGPAIDAIADRPMIATPTPKPPITLSAPLACSHSVSTTPNTRNECINIMPYAMPTDVMRKISRNVKRPTTETSSDVSASGASPAPPRCSTSALLLVCRSTAAVPSSCLRLATPASSAAMPHAAKARLSTTVTTGLDTSRASPVGTSWKASAGIGKPNASSWRECTERVAKES